MFPPAPSAAPLHQLDPTGSAALPPVREQEEEEDGEAAALPRSGASELRISSRLELQPIRATTGEKKYNSLCKTQNCLKGVWVWWGVPRGGRVSVGG